MRRLSASFSGATARGGVAIAAVIGACALPGTGAAHGQELARRIDAAGPDATARITFAAREGVCGAADGAWRIRRQDGHTQTVRAGGIRVASGTEARVVGGMDARVAGGMDAQVAVSGDADCLPGPIAVTLEREAGRITHATVRVATEVGLGGTPPGWFAVTPAAAVNYLLGEAAIGAASSSAARNMVFAAVLADAESWPDLLRLARSDAVDDAPRRAAVFWLGQAAGERAVAGLKSLVADDSLQLRLREDAVFALSRMGDAATPVLIDIARTHSEPRIRRSAMFWLAQSGSREAVAFFEDVLRGGP